MVVQIHSVDVDKHGLGDYGALMGTPTSVPYILRQIKTWAKAYKATETETIEDMEKLLKMLPELFPAEHAEKHSTLVHGDYRMDNMIFDKNTNDVRAVLDWELSTLGQ
jgi:aminoglycoside phosphotransferase (APT) family kinase protein